MGLAVAGLGEQAAGDAGLQSHPSSRVGSGWFSNRSSATGAGRRCMVHLLASSGTLEERVRRREPPGWFGLPELLASTRQLAAVRFADTDLEVNTEQQGPKEVAAAIVAEVRKRFGE
jgi:chloramphenicol 3-O-phosphotransferase